MIAPHQAHALFFKQRYKGGIARLPVETTNSEVNRTGFELLNGRNIAVCRDKGGSSLRRLELEEGVQRRCQQQFDGTGSTDLENLGGLTRGEASPLQQRLVDGFQCPPHRFTEPASQSCGFQLSTHSHEQWV